MAGTADAGAGHPLIADDLGSCRVDRSGLETAILNLAVNARDAVPDGGDLRITARNRTIPGADGDVAPGMKAGDWIEIAVCDTGTGMPPEVQAHVFEPFFTTKEPTGSWIQRRGPHTETTSAPLRPFGAPPQLRWGGRPAGPPRSGV